MKGLKNKKDISDQNSNSNLYNLLKFITFFLSSQISLHDTQNPMSH